MARRLALKPVALWLAGVLLCCSHTSVSAEACTLDDTYDLNLNEVKIYSCSSVNEEYWDFDYSVATTDLSTFLIAFGRDCLRKSTSEQYNKRTRSSSFSDSYTSNQDSEIACIKIECEEVSCQGRIEGSIETSGFALAGVIGAVVGALILFMCCSIMVFVMRRRRMMRRLDRQRRGSHDRAVVITTTQEPPPAAIPVAQPYPTSQPQAYPAATIPGSYASAASNLNPPPSGVPMAAPVSGPMAYPPTNPTVATATGQNDDTLPAYAVPPPPAYSSEYPPSSAGFQHIDGEGTLRD